VVIASAACAEVAHLTVSDNVGQGQDQDRQHCSRRGVLMAEGLGRSCRRGEEARGGLLCSC